MPVYTTLNTLQTVMQDRDLIRWKVTDDSGEMLHQYTPPETTTAADSFNTLKIFIEQLQGTNYVVIMLYDRKYKSNGGGALSQWVYKHFYKMPGAPVSNPVSTGMGGIDQNYIALIKELQDVKAEMREQKLQQQIERLESDLKRAEKENKGGYFEKVAETIGKTWAKEFLAKEGYNLDDQGVVTPVGNTTGPVKKETAETAKDLGKRGADAIVRLGRVGGNTDVIEALEKMAAIAETDPMKLAGILGALKE